ncbi:MAG: GrpE protein [Rickettsiaceae bacterium]|jgi:molecular chaperone GrpE|nr:GrpE protein [Rickettsiaceae bacterium]
MIGKQKTNDDKMDKNTEMEEDTLPETEQQESIDELANALSRKYGEEIQDLKDRLLRTTAEVENTRKRYEKMIEEAKDYSITSFARDLMEVMDNLYRALEHKPTNIEDLDIKNFILGVELINNELQNSFSKYGIVRILPQVGEKFNYNIHQAVTQVPTNDFEPGMIVNVMQAGYSLKDRLLRPAMVTVSITKNE